jgi:predicted RND superfamily exporter protein
LLVPGVIALASDTIGFVTIRLIEIRIIQEMAVIASLGVMLIVFTNMILLPVSLSYVDISQASKKRLVARAARFEKIWQALASLARRRNAAIIIAVALVLFVFGLWKGTGIRIGDLERGVPELRPDSRYNVDTRIISQKFTIGTDVITVYAEACPDACIQYAPMEAIDDFCWQLANVEGVHSVLSLPTVAKMITSGWYQGSLEWRVLSRCKDILREAVQYVPTTSGLLNRDCSVMPIYIFTRDHKADTISNIVSTIKTYRQKTADDLVRFKLAGGNVGVMAATNEEVVASQFPILAYVFAAVIGLCLITYRSIRATLCIILPLGLVSLLGYALMTILNIGLKVNTLPVVALGVGVGVDYGIYIYSRLESILKEGKPLEQAYRETLVITGNGVVLTGVTLAIGVATWIFSPLQFQADMGILLTFLFLVNMLGAVLLLPALAAWLLPIKTGEA